MSSRKEIPIFVVGKAGNVSDNGATVSYHIQPPIELPPHATFRIVEASIWWSIPNISPALNNNTLKYFSVANPGGKTIVFQKGLYDLNSINSNVSQFLENNGDPANGIIFSGDASTGKVSVQLNTGISVINWNDSLVRNILGFTQIATVNVNDADYYEADSLAKLNSVNALLIHTNFCSGSYYSDRGGSSVVSSVQPDVAIGRQIQYRPFHSLRSRVNVARLDEVVVWITDENNRKVDTNGEYWSVTGVIEYE